MVFVPEHDVVVFGAGPAGASAAIRLAEMGLDVGLVERCRFPRSHVGICISDETVALLDPLGLVDEFNNAQFWRRKLTAVRWGNAQTRLVAQDGYHLDRAVFDGLTIGKARLAGARVYQPAKLLDVTRLADLSWAVTVAYGERRQLLRARFLVDAAGRCPSIRGARIKDGPPLVSIHANWALEASAGFDGLIEAGEDAWLWYAQTAPDRAVVSVFCDPRRLKMCKNGGMQTKFASLLPQFRALNLEQLGCQCSDPQICDASSHHAEAAAGNDYIRLGDSCFSVDPLSSQGVHLALQSGLQGAIVVNTILRKPQNAEAARLFFRTRVAERIGLYANRTKQEYARVSASCTKAFWLERADNASVIETNQSHRRPLPCAPGSCVAVSADLSLDTAPVIEGDFVEVRQVVRHPSIDGPIAYVAGADLVRLLSLLPLKFAYCDVPAMWKAYVPPDMGGEIASWLWDRQILVRAA